MADLRGRPDLFPPSLRVERGADDSDGTDESAVRWDPLVDLDGARLEVYGHYII